MATPSHAEEAMKDAIGAFKAAAVFASFAVLVCPGQAAAMTVGHFLSMSEDEENAYIRTMARAAENILHDAGKPKLARRVDLLFLHGPKQPNDNGAIEEFQGSADSFWRQEVVREYSGEKSKDGPVLVEEMMVKQLRSHQIEVPASFMAAAKAGKLTEVAKQRGLPAVSPSVQSDDDPIGQGGFITPPTPPKGA